MEMKSRICNRCGSQYRKSCAKCTIRIKTWGEEGTRQLLQLAKRTVDIHAEELLAFCEKYYIGKSDIRVSVTTLKIGLGILGYEGNFIGRIHKNNMDYAALRKREHEAGRRYSLRKEKCELCGSTIELRLHHIVPLSWGGLSTDDNCITLCKDCHLKTHRILSRNLSRSLLLKYLRPHQEEIIRLALESVT